MIHLPTMLSLVACEAERTAMIQLRMSGSRMANVPVIRAYGATSQTAADRLTSCKVCKGLAED